MFEDQTRLKAKKSTTRTQQNTNMPENKFIMQGQQTLYFLSPNQPWKSSYCKFVHRQQEQSWMFQNFKTEIGESKNEWFGLSASPPSSNLPHSLTLMTLHSAGVNIDPKLSGGESIVGDHNTIQKNWIVFVTEKFLVTLGFFIK